ncbi:phosphotransferase [Glycomyces dulcitolivorans]|uniref:phosphotransferase n=1 Tax=Glycomyces dulcitolivorans TaxID=2200759 RepID=UPI000DD30C26|nr:aminoglycoside phosphotransferase family protein [Glycomyces dulcitolivorans]
MHAAEIERAVATVKAIGASVGLEVEEAVVLHDSNKLSLRLLPCDSLARVAPLSHRIAAFEIDLAQRLGAAGCPVGELDPRVEPRVYGRGDFDVTLWTYYEPVGGEVPAPEYAAALERLHAGMRRVGAPVPHFTDRVEEAQRVIADREGSPGLAEADRELLGDVLRDLRASIAGRGAEQLLHGEPHPGNLLATKDGPRFIDFETCCRGPVEFDLAHAPDEVADHYPGVDRDLLRECRLLMLAMITAWRWEPGDQLPDGRRLAEEWTAQIRAAI